MLSHSKQSKCIPRNACIVVVILGGNGLDVVVVEEERMGARTQCWLGLLVTMDVTTALPPLIVESLLQGSNHTPTSTSNV